MKVQVIYNENERQRIVNVDLLASNKIAPQGLKGDSVYTVAKKNGFQGTEEQWLASLKGERGEPGPQGEKGQKGDKGEIGPRGAQGQIGPQGIQGIQGVQGQRGPQGIQGEPGPKGDTGAQGIQGEKGDTGSTGPKGDKGDKGDTGQQGPQGEKGDTGTTGADGYSPIITVTDITGGHRVAITDASDTYTFDVMDGNVAEAPVQDVQVNGTSVLTDGVANVPLATDSSAGVIKADANTGAFTDANGKLYISKASDAQIKTGANVYRSIPPNKADLTSFYGLAKAAGDTTQSQSDNAVGVYTNDAKTAIKTMLGVEDPAVDDVQINGTSIVSNGVAEIPVGNNNTFGVYKTEPSFGITVNNVGKLFTNIASPNEMKIGSQGYKPIVPATQHTSTFYGLAKAAGDATQSASDNAVGVYTDSAKTAIKTMLGIEIDDTLSVEGAPADAKKTGDEITGLKEDLDEIEDQFDSFPTIKDSDKTEVDIDVSDNDGNVILRLSGGHIQTKEFDSKHISVETDPTIKQSTKPDVDLDISDLGGNVLLRVSDGNIKTKNFDSREFVKEKVVTVKKDGTGDFTTLRAAADSIVDASKNNPYRIEVYPGTYNVLEDYTDAEIREADVSEYHQGFVGLMLGDGVSLVGVGCRDDIIINGTLDPTEYNSTIRGNISTLNIAGNMRLENLTIVCLYLRYCVHDDFYAPNNTETYDRVVKNCRFDMQRNVSASADDTSTILPNAYGAGMNGKGMNAYFENCDFSTGLGVHTSGSNSAFPTRTIVKNCSGYAFRPNDRNESSVRFEFIVDNCNFDVIRYGHYSDDENQVFYINGTGNNMTMLNCSATDVINIGNRTRHKNTFNLPVLTMVKRNGSTYEKTTDSAVACGIIVLISDGYCYIQKCGYINSNILGMSNLAIGDYITVDTDGILTTTGATASNAVGIITSVDEYGVAYMKMLVGQEV